MGKIVIVSGGVCDLCKHTQEEHKTPEGCTICDCKSRGKRV